MSESTSTSYDYIVVGAGSAGAAVVNRLSESGEHRVLCLEAGKESSDYFWSRVPAGIAKLIDNPAVNWCYSSEPDEGSGGRRIEVPRGRMLGGSSSINGMVYIRGQAQDYNHWAQLGNQGWSYQDILPIFKRMECYAGGSDELRGRDGPLRITQTPRLQVPLLEKMIEAAATIGLPFNPDLNGESQEGIGMSQVTIARGRRQSTAYCYLDPARRRRNLDIVQGAMVESLLIEKKRCLGVSYSIDGRKHEAQAEREVIVSGGSINSPKLLELSGIGQPKLLANLGITSVHDLPGVGENLRDHYSPRVKFKITEPNATYNDNARGWRLAREVARYALFRDGFLAQTSVPLRMYFRTREGLETPDATISVLPFIYEMVGRERRISRTKGITMNINVLRSESIGSIHVKSADPLEPPAIRFNFLSARHDREGLLAAMRKARELMATSPVKEVTGQELAPGAHVRTDEELLDWVRHHAETTYHPVGTCKMGIDPMAVVDPELRVYGIEGLRVADASVMPTLTSGNTNAPSIMIGEKCAQMVLAKMKRTVNAA
ncbi:MAG: choline dehydrogenase [Rhodospirillaceae bacterium]|nr:choline dehydrogenase [Rhodospirillaceae bacterium]